jgi:hypothetical protein
LLWPFVVGEPANAEMKLVELLIDPLRLIHYGQFEECKHSALGVEKKEIKRSIDFLAQHYWGARDRERKARNAR